MSGMKFALTQPYQCNYLPDEKEQLLVLMPPESGMQSTHYEWLITSGFRRSGDQVYRPHCDACNACRSVRVLVDEFVPSRSQKRLLSKTKCWQTRFISELSDEHYDLYKRYIEQRHHGGAMYPPSKTQFEHFIRCYWHPPQFLEARIDDTLIALAVTDCFGDAFSALYTFFEPDLSEQSLGTSMILLQIQKAREHGKRYLYLGYQVEGCQKMAYKDKFLPQEQFEQGKWRLIAKKA